MEEHIIQTINLTKEYGKLRAVDNVSLSIRKGEIIFEFLRLVELDDRADNSVKTFS